MKDRLIQILDKVEDRKLNSDDALNQVLDLFGVNDRFHPEQMAKWFHDNYEEIAKKEGWETQDKCNVEFNDLPESNRNTMIKVCERWLNGF